MNVGIIYSLSDLLKENPLLCCKVSNIDLLYLLKKHCKDRLQQENGMSDRDRNKFKENLSALVDYDEAIRGLSIIEMIKKLQNFIENPENEGEVLKIHDNYEVNLDIRGARRLYHHNLYIVIYCIDKALEKNPLLCTDKIMPLVKSYAQSRIESDDLNPSDKEKIQENLEVLGNYSKIIDLLDNEKDVQNGCGCTPSLFGRQQPLSRIKQLENFINICPEEGGGVFVLDNSYAINLYRQGATQLLERCNNRPRSTFPIADSSRAASSRPSVAPNSPELNSYSRRRDRDNSRQGCTIM